MFLGACLLISELSRDLSQNADDSSICAGTGIADADEISPKIVPKVSKEVRRDVVKLS